MEKVVKNMWKLYRIDVLEIIECRAGIVRKNILDCVLFENIENNKDFIFWNSRVKNDTNMGGVFK